MERRTVNIAPEVALSPEALSPHPAPPPETSRDLLDLVLEATARPVPPGGPDGAGAGRPSDLERFLNEPSPARALALWLGPDYDATSRDLRGRVARRLNRDVARLDGLLNRQINSLLHHPDFQRLEASWRGLHHLVEQVPEAEGIKVRVLSLSRKELEKDLLHAVEFDRSQLFRKVYSDEFDMPGGEPFGALLGDYEFTHHPADLDVLSKVAEVAAAAFAPFVAAAHPSLLQLTGFAELERPLNLPRTFEQVPYVKWHSLRQAEDARFVGLALPRVLMRLPYRDDNNRLDGFRFHEEVGRPDRGDYLWGNAAYAFGSVLVRAFAVSGWLADIRGVRRGQEGGGLVPGLPVHSFSTDKDGLVPRCSTDVIITDALDKELGDLGLLPLSWCQDTGKSAFYGSQSIQRPRAFDQLEATVNARLSAALQYIFCASRFAHYIKVMVRDKVGGHTGPAELEDYLSRWLLNYTNANESASQEMKARHPLRDARVEVVEVRGAPGRYACKVYLRPQFQLEQLAGTIELRARLTETRG